MTLPIRWKIALSALVAITVGLLAAGWLTLQSIERLELTRLEETLMSRTALAAVPLQRLVDTDSPSFSASQLQTIVKEISGHALARITVIKPNGLVLADSDTADEAVTHLDNHLTRPEVAKALADGRGTTIRLSATTGKRMFYLALPIRSADERLVGIVRLALPMTALDARIRDFEHALGVAFGIALAIAAVLSVFLSRGLTRPLSDMAAVARQLAAGSLRQRIATTARDEIGVLGNALDHMADQLESTIREVTEDRAQLLAVLSSMAEGVMVLDCRGVVLQINSALEQIFLIQSTTARGRMYQEVIRLQELNELVMNVLDTRLGRSGEITTAPSGYTLHVEASVAGGRLENEACVVLVFHDVTAIRRLEKVRKDFVANVSHELRTPLTSIKGYVEALLDGIKDHPDEALRFLHIILKQSDRLNLILDDLLQLSQIESGQVLFKRDPVLLRSVVERTVALIQPILDKKGHHLAVSLSDALPSVLGDEERLVQVLTNLLDNAVKYTPQRGTIVIAARHLDATQSGTPSDLIELSVSDNGIGIPEADRPRVFERFYRVDKARSRELGGTGLGLAIVKHIVEGHGGQIRVEPNQPMGTRFVMTLPVAGMNPMSN
jgi:two-component system, OmpR family, phosphate regulon sensor histidine kinase PhoR